MDAIFKLFGIACLCAAGAMFVGIVVASAVRAWLKKRKSIAHNRTTVRIPRIQALIPTPFIEGNPMSSNNERNLLNAVPYDYDASINDYQRDRVQDQELNDLAMRLMDMERLPWEVRRVDSEPKIEQSRYAINAEDVFGKDNSNRPASGLLAVIRSITAISKPVASAGSQRNNSKAGSHLYITAGKARFSCDTQLEHTECLRDLNADTAKRLLPLRKNLLKMVHDYASTGAEIGLTFPCWCAYASPQDCAVAATEVEAIQLTAELNGIYLRITQPIRSKLLKEIQEWAASSMASLSAPTPKEEQPVIQ